MFHSGQSIDARDYADTFTITIRTDTGAPFERFSQNVYGLGPGSFNGESTRQTGWFTKELHPPEGSDVSYVRFDALVSNVRDNYGDSFLNIRKVSFCEKCASCAECPSLAKCQETCITPRENTCVFYQTCAEATLRCGSSNYLLAQAETTCWNLRDFLGQPTLSSQRRPRQL